jgi:hypothetical protein
MDTKYGKFALFIGSPLLLLQISLISLKVEERWGELPKTCPTLPEYRVASQSVLQLPK